MQMNNNNNTTANKTHTPKLRSNKQQTQNVQLQNRKNDPLVATMQQKNTHKQSNTNKTTITEQRKQRNNTSRQQTTTNNHARTVVSFQRARPSTSEPNRPFCSTNSKNEHHSSRSTHIRHECKRQKQKQTSAGDKIWETGMNCRTRTRTADYGGTKKPKKRLSQLPADTAPQNRPKQNYELLLWSTASHSNNQQGEAKLPQHLGNNRTKNNIMNLCYSTQAKKSTKMNNAKHTQQTPTTTTQKRNTHTTTTTWQHHACNNK